MYRIELRPTAAKDLKKLPIVIQKRIGKKLLFFQAQADPLLFAVPLVGGKVGDYRFRIGDYRVVFDLVGQRIMILSIEHRREVYRK